MKKLLGILVLSLLFCNISFGDEKNLPSLFGIQLSDKVTNYQFFPPHTEDKYFVAISPPIKNDDFEFYTVKFNPLGMIYENNQDYLTIFFENQINN